MDYKRLYEVALGFIDDCYCGISYAEDCLSDAYFKKFEQELGCNECDGGNKYHCYDKLFEFMVEEENKKRINK